MNSSRFAASFFARLLITGCILGITPLFILGYLSFSKSSAIVQEEVVNRNGLIMQQNRQQVEMLLKTTDTLATQMLNSPVTTSDVSVSSVLRLPYQFENHKLFDSLIYKLVQIQVFELGIEDVNLMSFRQNWLINEGIVYSTEASSSGQEQDVVVQALKQRLAADENSGKSSYWKLIETSQADSRYKIRLVKNVPLFSSNPDGLLTVDIPLKEIDKRLTGHEQLGTVFIADENGTVISHPDATRVGTSVADQPYFQTIVKRGEPESHFTYEMNGGQFAIVCSYSRYNGWYYISLTPLQSIAEKSDAIKWYTTIAALVLIAAVVLTATLISFRMYSPIRRIRRFIQPDDIRVTGDEMSFIGERIRHMIQDRDRMNHEIQGLNDQARAFFVVRLLQGGLKSKDIDEGLDKFKFPANWEGWCLFAIQIDTLEETRYTENDRHLMMYAICNIVEEIVPTEQRLSPLLMDRSLFLFVGKPLDESKPFKVEMFHTAETILQKIKHYLDLPVSIGISRIYKQLADAPFACQESLDALTYRIRLGHESILFIDEVQTDKDVHLHYPRELELRLIDAVRQMDLEQAKQAVTAMLDSFSEHRINHDDYRLFLARLCNNLIGIVQDEGGSVQDVFQRDVLQPEKWLYAHSAEQLHGWLEQQVLTPLIAWLQDRQSKRDIHISEEIVKMIRLEYDKDLTIDTFSSRLNFHPNYISRVFKKEMGVTFTDYLSQFRVEMAKKWLRDTDMKISEIAERLRYSTASNFNRIFKKTERITPTEYRDKCRHDAESGKS